MDDLPELWYCSLNTWAPAYNRCAAREESDTILPPIDDSDNRYVIYNCSRKKDNKGYKDAVGREEEVESFSWKEAKRDKNKILEEERRGEEMKREKR